MIQFPKDFFFGVSNAASQVEDQLQNNFTRMAEQDRIPNFKNIKQPLDRIHFWSQPEIELDLAKELGCGVFRLSLAWERLVPEPGVWDEAAASHYQKILGMIRERGMKVMLTLFHHSLPCWFEDSGGWVNPESVAHFKFYSENAFLAFDRDVDYWITLNEPVIWSILTYAEGVLPPGKKGSWFAHMKSLKHMAKSHNEFFELCEAKTPVGIAHHMGAHVGRGFFNQYVSKISDYLLHWQFLAKIKDHMSFFGINYYGAEWITLQGPALYDDIEFSDAGRAVHPEGLYGLLKKINKLFPRLPIIITENGVGDVTDNLRQPYLLEHLKLIHTAIQAGLPVIGYVHWTLTDNWEWVDGYGPKFGLVEVLRDENFARKKRDSFFIYQNIIRQNGFSEEFREQVWAKYYSEKIPRPFWRAADGKGCLAQPILRPTPEHFWKIKS